MGRSLKKSAIWAVILAVLFTAGFTFIVLSQLGVGKHPLSPALDSGWFVPHLAAYMTGYAVMATATAMALWFAIRRKPHPELVRLLTKVGWVLLTIGLTLGSLWAKSAWGSFWNWDPKETWALITWAAYLIYLLLPSGKTHIIMLVIAFLFLQMCWWGINLLPAVSSIHLYK